MKTQFITPVFIVLMIIDQAHAQKAVEETSYLPQFETSRNAPTLQFEPR